MSESLQPSKALGFAIRAARVSEGLTQEELAARARLGTSTLRQIEAGNAHGPSLFAVLRLVAALDEDVSLLAPTLEACRTADGPRHEHRNAGSRLR